MMKAKPAPHASSSGIKMVKRRRMIAPMLITLLAFLLGVGESRAAIGQQCFVGTVGLNGMIGTLGAITGGTVSAVVILNPGKNYVTADSLSASNANLGGAGSGFSVPVASTSVNSSLAGGSVNMYIPNTTTPKPTWNSRRVAKTGPDV
jgi:hypothetical protein